MLKRGASGVDPRRYQDEPALVNWVPVGPSSHSHSRNGVETRPGFRVGDHPSAIPSTHPKNGDFIENSRGDGSAFLDVRGVHKRRTGTRFG